MKVAEIIIACLLFLGALRVIRLASWFIFQAYETDKWAAMYQLTNYPSKRLAGYAVCCGVVILLLAGTAGFLAFV